MHIPDYFLRMTSWKYKFCDKEHGHFSGSHFCSYSPIAFQKDLTTCTHIRNTQGSLYITCYAQFLKTTNCPSATMILHVSFLRNTMEDTPNKTNSQQVVLSAFPQFLFFYPSLGSRPGEAVLSFISMPTADVSCPASSGRYIPGCHKLYSLGPDT